MSKHQIAIRRGQLDLLLFPFTGYAVSVVCRRTR